jgi:hypothetical protein
MVLSENIMLSADKVMLSDNMLSDNMLSYFSSGKLKTLFSCKKFHLNPT